MYPQKKPPTLGYGLIECDLAEHLKKLPASNDILNVINEY